MNFSILGLSHGQFNFRARVFCLGNVIPRFLYLFYYTWAFKKITRVSSLNNELQNGKVVFQLMLVYLRVLPPSVEMSLILSTR